MRGSQLDRRVTLQVNAATSDPTYGSPVVGWVTFAGAARIPAQVQDVLPSKSEGTEHGIRIGRRTARVRIRYLAGVTSAMRIVLHESTDTVLQIVGGPAEIGRREWTEFVVEWESTVGEP